MPYPPFVSGGQVPTCIYKTAQQDCQSAFDSYASDYSSWSLVQTKSSAYSGANSIPNGGDRWVFEIAAINPPFSIPVKGPLTLR